MKKFIPTVLISILLASACRTETEISKEIDYSALPDIPVELFMEIGESEDFIPAQLRDFVLASDGSMLVSDWGSVTIEQFSPEGEHTGTIAAEGGGPGELDAFFYMRSIGHDTVMVSQQQGRKDFFAPDESGSFSFIKSVLAENRERPLNIIGPYSDSEYFASTVNRIGDVQRAISNPEDYQITNIVISDSDDNIIADSLHQLKSPMPHLTQINNGFTFNTIPYRFHERFIQIDEGKYIIARPDSSALFVYNENHEIHQRIPLTVPPRPVTSNDIEYFLKDVDRKIRQDLEPRIFDEKPPYLDLWVTENYIWLHTDTGEEGKEMVLIDFEGNPAGKFMLSEMDEIKHVEGERIYTLHKNPDLGDSIRIYEIMM